MQKSAMLTFVALVALAACSERNGTATAPADGDAVNAGTTLTEPTTARPTGQADAENPQTGTNSGRPDAPDDLKPGTDGNTNPPAP